VPRPAMLVEMVTAPRRPLCATISLSRSTFSGRALSTCGPDKRRGQHACVAVQAAGDALPRVLCFRGQLQPAPHTRPVLDKPPWRLPRQATCVFRPARPCPGSSHLVRNLVLGQQGRQDLALLHAGRAHLRSRETTRQHDANTRMLMQRHALGLQPCQPQRMVFPSIPSGRTSTGRPVLCMRLISVTTAFHLYCSSLRAQRTTCAALSQATRLPAPPAPALTDTPLAGHGAHGKAVHPQHGAPSCGHFDPELASQDGFASLATRHGR
jgi:hypothetical protein